MSVLDTAEYRRLALLAAGVDPSQIPCILDTATWRRLMIAALVAISEGSGDAGYVNGSVQFYADLPVTVGTPPVNTAYLVREDSGVWFINRKPAGIYVRLFNNGVLADWDYAGEFPSVNDSQYFRIYDTADPTREIAFSAASIGTGQTRTVTVPNKNVTLDDASDPRTPTAHTHPASQISDSTAAGRALLTGADAAAQRTSLGLGTANNVTFASIQNTPIGSTTPAAGTFTTLTANNGTLTASAPVVTFSQTWNNVAVAFVGFRVNVTDTASSPNSSIAEFQLNGASYLRLQKEKNTGLQCCLDVGAGTNASMDFQCGGNRIFRAYAAAAGNQPLYLETNGGLQFSPISPSTANFRMQAEAANILGCVQGTAAQTIRLYSTFTSATNFERLNIASQTGGSFILGTEKGSGGGTARALEFRTDNTARLTIGSAGGFTLADANDIAVGTTTGTKIGTATTQKIGFFNATPVVQPAAVADSTDATNVATQLNALLARLRTLGLIAT